MTDIEKVIKALEMCIADDLCNGCPYEDQCFSDGVTSTEQMMRDALALLEEQEPVEPKPNHLFPGGWSCGGCGSWISRVHNYCPYCGKKVKW